MKTWQDTRYDNMDSVASWVFGAGIAICTGMCDGVLDTREMAVW
jgi:hypothetical protein